ncbi:hypothetical protein C8R44DRAFT_890151 [Mycena epipterygia]|nr:hypothetical protein C8R44DRAFT_890151 [Mycena epipterygia]
MWVIVRTFRHAVAPDERRAKFKQNMCRQPKKPAVAANAQLNGHNGPSVVTDVQEVWFADCHCDVGGGSVLNGTRPTGRQPMEGAAKHRTLPLLRLSRL